MKINKIAQNHICNNLLNHILSHLIEYEGLAFLKKKKLMFMLISFKAHNMIQYKYTTLSSFQLFLK